MELVSHHVDPNNPKINLSTSLRLNSQAMSRWYTLLIIFPLFKKKKNIAGLPSPALVKHLQVEGKNCS